MSFDPEPYAAGLRAANEREGREIAARARDAIAESKRLAEAIGRADQEVRAVYLFGSLAKGLPTQPGFDIDLALQGGDTYRAMDAAADSDFEVDIVDLALLPAKVRETILLSGVKLYER